VDRSWSELLIARSESAWLRCAALSQPGQYLSHNGQRSIEQGMLSSPGSEPNVQTAYFHVHSPQHSDLVFGPGQNQRLCSAPAPAERRLGCTTHQERNHSVNITQRLSVTVSFSRPPRKVSTDTGVG
jgi:hypothetical protein